MDLGNLQNMGNWERMKAVFLMDCMEDLDIDLEYCEIGVNENSGYTYIYSEMEAFTLYMPIYCELTKNDVWVETLNPVTEEEEETELENMEYSEIVEWIDSLNIDEKEA